MIGIDTHEKVVQKMTQLGTENYTSIHSCTIKFLLFNVLFAGLTVWLQDYFSYNTF